MNAWKTLSLCAAVALSLLAVEASAVKVGEKLYIRSRNTRLLDAPGGTKVLGVLQPGATVVWQGKHPSKPGWHLVEVNGKKGALLTANLSTTPPRMEILASKGREATDANAFLSSGAATKALGAGAMAYGKEKSLGESVKGVVAMEALGRAVTAHDISAHARKAGIHDAVGPVAEAAGTRAGGSR
jgi:hypothetical protein